MIIAAGINIASRWPFLHQEYMVRQHPWRCALLLFSLLVVLTGCGRKAVEETAYDNTEEVETYYRDNPDRFVFATLEDVPENLPWEDGSELTPFGDP